MAAWRAIGDPRFTAFGLNLLSQTALIFERYDEARAALEESVELNRSVDARWNLGAAYRGLGAVAHAQGEYEQALVMFHQSLDTFAELGGRQEVARVLAEMGHSLLALGDDIEAERIWRESLSIATETHGSPVALEALGGLARLQAKRGDTQQALGFLLIVLNHPASVQETKDRAARLYIELESQSTSLQVNAAHLWARSQTLETAVGEVLNQV
jgi:tetratricopeptide (TPR) repeat protein